MARRRKATTIRISFSDRDGQALASYIRNGGSFEDFLTGKFQPDKPGLQAMAEATRDVNSDAEAAAPDRQR